MDPLRRWIAYWNRKVRKLTIIDMKFAQGAAMALTLIIVNLFPQIMSLSVWWFVALLIICAVRPFYVIWIKDDPTDQPSD